MSHVESVAPETLAFISMIPELFSFYQGNVLLTDCSSSLIILKHALNTH